MPKPNVTMTVEPFEDGQLVYLAAVPLSAGETPEHRLHFRLKIKNEGRTAETLQKITVAFFPTPGSTAGALFRSFDRDITIGPGTSSETHIFKDENIPVPDLPLVKYQIRLHFLDHDEPVISAGLARPHVSPTPQGSYRFFGNTDDMGFHEYFVPNRHEDTAQFFEYDVTVQRWISAENTFRKTKPGSSLKKNEDYFGYGKPLYAMADGTVISFINNVDDNPIPGSGGERALIRIADNEAGLVSTFSLARVNNTLMATAVRTATGALKIILWELETPGNDVVNSQLVRLGDIEAAEKISNVDVFALRNDRLITVIRLVNGALKVIVWDIADNGMSLTRLADDEAETANQLAAVRLTNSRFGVAIITAAGNLKLIIWDVSSDGETLTRQGEAQAGGVSRLDVAALSGARLLTAVRTQSNTLKLITWDIAEDGSITRRGDATTADLISEVSLAWIRNFGQDDSFTMRAATAVRTSTNKLKVAYWDIDQSGNVQLLDQFDKGQAQGVKLAHVHRNGNDSATCMITRSGTLHLTTWKYSSGAYNIFSQNTAGVTDLVDLIWLRDKVPHTLVTAVRTAQQTLKLIVWFLAGGGGNHIYILHGDELVYFAHMKKGSINPALRQMGASVEQGQFVGQLGNSGSSGGPHVHIEASQAPPGMTAAEMIDEHQNGTLLSKLVYRPMPFHNAQAMRLADVTPGPGVINNDPFAKVDGNGFYWDAMAVWPGMTTPGIPTGRPGLTFWGVLSNNFQALFDAVTGANYHLVWFDGYSKGNTLRFNVLFRPDPAPAWSMKFGLTGRLFERLVKKRDKEGFRLVHVNSYQIGDKVRYAAIFRKADGMDWKAYHDRPVHEHQALFEKFRDDGFAPINVSVISIEGERRYTALYEKRNVGVFFLKSKLTTEAYQEEFFDQGEAGRQVAYLDAYLHNGSVRYSAIWNEEHKGSTVRGHHHQTSAQLQEKFDDATGDGFVTAMLAGYSVNNESHFAAIWRK